MEVLEERFASPAWRAYADRYQPWNDEAANWRQFVFTGQLLHFREVDDELGLPPGTAEHLLVPVVTKRYPGKVEQLTETHRAVSG